MEDNKSGYVIEEPEPSPEPTQGQQQVPNQNAQGPQNYQPQFQKPRAHTRPPKPKKNLLIYVIIAIFLAVAVAIIIYHPSSSPPPINGTTTIPHATSSLIKSCISINSPGTYTVSSNLTYTKFTGSCITIASNNVKLVCNNSIGGSGPFAIGTNHTYGIYINDSSNVSVINCHIYKFSYGIGAHNSNYLNITDNNASDNILSNLFLNNVTNSDIHNNKFIGTTFENGSIHIIGTSNNNTISYNNVTSNNRGVFIESPGNSYLNNNVNNTNASFYCAPGSGMYGTSTAKSNICSNDFGCSFLYCSGNNILANVSNITLSSNINSCGSIKSPGDYYISNDINASYIEPFGDVWQNSFPCINIMSSYVNLYCDNNSISNASTGININNMKNVNITGCNISAKNTGIMVENSDGLTVTNTTVTGANHGISILNSSVNQFIRFKVYHNTIGIYLNGSFSNTFSNGYARNNSLIDIYASNDSLAPLSNLVLKTSCGISDASWAVCDHYMNSSLKFFGVTSCTPLTLSGNYMLENNVLSQQQNCFNIGADNVTLDCNNYALTNQYSGNSKSSAVYINGRKNVKVINCTASNFYAGINVSDSSNVSAYNNTLGGPQQQVGISLVNVFAANIMNNTITHGVSDIYASKVTHSNISNNTLSYSNVPGYAIYLDNSVDNIVNYNNGTNNYGGIYLKGDSMNNTVSYNRMSLDTYADYVCSSNNSGISAENGGINYGTKKVNCRWMAAISVGQVLPCAAAMHPSTYTLAYDAVYGAGTTCFSVYANSTTINCANHTIIATDGGTFASFISTTGSKLENCNLKGFTNSVQVSGSDTNIYNNTIYTAQPPPNTTAYAINVVNSAMPSVSHNNITSKSGGIYLSNVTDGIMNNNIVKSLSISYYLLQTYLTNIKNNIASQSSGSGWVFDNSTENEVTGNSFYGQTYGVKCLGTSIAQDSNTNSGNNYTNNLNCGWLS